MKLSRLVIWLVVLVVVLIIVSILVGTERARTPAPATGDAAANQLHSPRIPPPQPAPTASDTIAQQNERPFSLLISYTNDGFEPVIAHVHAGDTVRFTNNSTGQLWVAASGDKLYPNVQDGCGSSALDSCQALGPGEFWEFTFTQKGTWTFVNNLDKSMQGTIVVQ